MSDTSAKFEAWAVLEQMGHNRYAGLVSVDRCLGDEKVARAAAATFRARPVDVYIMPQLSADQYPDLDSSCGGEEE